MFLSRSAKKGEGGAEYDLAGAVLKEMATTAVREINHMLYYLLPLSSLSNCTILKLYSILLSATSPTYH